MFATPPPTGPGTPPSVQPLTHQPAHQQGSQLPPGGQYGTPQQQPVAYTQPVAATGWAPAPALAPARQVATQLTGAYAASGDAGIDRMLAFEAACKRFGSLQ